MVMVRGAWEAYAIPCLLESDLGGQKTAPLYTE